MIAKFCFMVYNNYMENSYRNDGTLSKEEIDESLKGAEITKFSKPNKLFNFKESDVIDAEYQVIDGKQEATE
jgi:hypothetical protein